MFYSADGRSQSFCGVAIVVGEKQTHGSFERFLDEQKSAKLDLDQLSSGIVQFKVNEKQRFGFHWNDDPHDLGVWRNGERHDWNQHRQYLYRSEFESLLESKWGSGDFTLFGRVFSDTLSEIGN